ncbi:RecQ family ATP-dependent DNA helicase [Catenulispora sp. NF23]|uniref:RecQ family ATP-dependent DNA helicase n=1 Tax=Catenulispora pinistramenti TaxID=2705254 RepID=UPI001BA75D69|nr:DEAD/DEAH box helicase [Catenulispora pinistramenti]MBS2537840.1 RecQ family ATP-dependent DNA helicase [Catenulispora pinistramenti]
MSNTSTATAASSSPALREEAETLLRRLAGESARLREDQWTAIHALVADRRRALVVQRTGWGKSAVYFIATALLRARGSGPTVIVSPLLALMRNQIDAADRAGIRARTINSANLHEWEEIRGEVAAGEVDVLLISPERLNNPDFRDEVLPKLASEVGLLVVDEAHTVSDWGHDFRPDYRRIHTFLADLPPGVPVLATTATANARVVADVAEQLGTHSDGDTLVLRGTLERESLALHVVRLGSPEERFAYLAEQLPELPGSGIVYTLTVAAADELTAFLRGRGFEVAAYSGRTEDAERREAEADLLANRVKALVATSALGMGFDKPDLGFVVHLGAPNSPIAYYQQVGRAGRGVDHAEVLLLPGYEDQAIWRYFASLAFPPEEQVRQTLDVLADAGRPMSTAALESRVDLRRSRLESMLKVLDVDGAVRRVKGGWASTGEPWAYDAERYRRVAAAREDEQRAMLTYETTDECRMVFLRRQLDDPHIEGPCGRCDNCAGVRFAPTVSGADAQAARAALAKPGVVIASRKIWPTGMSALGVQLSGKIPPAENAEPGRALGRLTDLGWGARLRDLLTDGTPDQPLPEPMVDGIVKVLAAWDWKEQPTAVVSIGSRSRPTLITDTAHRIAAIGRLEYLGSAEPAGTPGQTRRGNSAQRLKQVHDAFTLSAGLAEAVAAHQGPILLVDDSVDTGWTMTVAAGLLRRAGAGAVLPFALAVQG